MGCASSGQGVLPAGDGALPPSRADLGESGASQARSSPLSRPPPPALPRPVWTEMGLTARKLQDDSRYLELRLRGLSWSKHSENGRVYWHNAETGRSVWDNPPEDSLELSKPVPVSGPLTKFSLQCLQLKLLQKDYVSMRHDYDRHKPYRCISGQYDKIEVKTSSEPCVLCRSRPCDTCIFPCQHACLCSKCVIDCNVGPESAPPKPGDRAWSSCPVCAGEVKRVTGLTKDQVVEYWNWAYDVRPPLPKGFAVRFGRNSVVGGVSMPKKRRSSSTTGKNKRENRMG